MQGLRNAAGLNCSRESEPLTTYRLYMCSQSAVCYGMQATVNTTSCCNLSQVVRLWAEPQLLDNSTATHLCAAPLLDSFNLFGACSLHGLQLALTRSLHLCQLVIILSLHPPNIQTKPYADDACATRTQAHTRGTCVAKQGTIYWRRQTIS